MLPVLPPELPEDQLPLPPVDVDVDVDGREVLEEPELPEELVVVEDSRESLQSVDSNSSSNGSLDSSEDDSLAGSEVSAEDADDSPLLVPTVEIRPVPSTSPRAIATTRLLRKRATKTPITWIQ